MNLRFESPFESQQRGTPPQQISAHDPINSGFTLKTGFGGTPIFFVASIGVSSEVAPGGTVTVEIGATNAAIRVSGDDPDVCRDGINDGFSYTATIDPEWTDAVSRTVCLGSGMAAPEMETIEIPAPTVGGQSYTVDVTVANTNSGGGSTLTKTVTVPESNNGGDLDPGVGDDDKETGDDTDNQPAMGGLLGLLFGGDVGGLGVGFAGGLAFLVVLLVLLIAVSGG